MASTFFRPSRVIAVALVVGALVWIGSRAVGPQAQEVAAPAVAATTAVPLQRVGVIDAAAANHQQQIVLSCITQADHSAQAVARGPGVITAISVKLGSAVKSGQTIATISDEGRQAGVNQAQALLDQRQSEYDSNKKLIDQGTIAKSQLPALESAVAAAKAGLSAAQAEAAKVNITSPIDGVINELPMQVGQAVVIGSAIATVVDPDPMLAVGAVSEAKRVQIGVGEAASVRFIDSSTIAGMVSFVGLSADKTTRTYPVRASFANPKAAIADGVTCEMTVTLPAVMAIGVPRSALIFSDDGHLGVRTVTSANKAQFVPVTIVDDGVDTVWLTGLGASSHIITVGQDFVRDGDPVVAVPATDATAPTGAPA
jgi:multidrug efflux system membrane fusion protein